jgi:hypothetical protein
MFNWTWAEWGKFALIWAGVFALIGGIVAQTQGGASGRGFAEGMWKGIEIFFLVCLVVGIIIAVLWGMGNISNTLNTAG